MRIKQTKLSVVRRSLLAIVPVFAFSALFAVAAIGYAAKPTDTIQSGNIQDTAGNTITVGYDKWGYNYQAHMFNGKYCDAYRDATWCQPYVDDNLSMKWNDAWLSNRDRDSDGLLDRHYGYDSYIGSGAWCTNHQSGIYEGEDGQTYKWTYFVKIVAAPADAYKEDGVWHTAEGEEIGPDVWGEFAITQEVYNDQGSGEHGIQYLSPYKAGFGAF